MTSEAELSGWGRWPRYRCRVESLGVDRTGLGKAASIARGLGRSYGDSAINQQRTLTSDRLNRFISFDPDTGMLVLEAGVSIGDIIATFLPRGYFLPVTPGTKFVTVGGMIASDVHGKNHHGAGSFGDHLEWFDLLCADGNERRCSAGENSALFKATIGGMGLTGHILRAGFKLMPVETGWIEEETIPARSLEHAIELMEQNLDRTYSVAWIDCVARGDSLGRSLVYLGEHAALADLAAKQRADRYASKARRGKRVPLDFPNWALNAYSVRAFNELYYRTGLRKAGKALVGWDSYFYPLDAITEWNRIYGSRGFVQYQCALPLEQSTKGLFGLLEEITASGLGSFLAVLKRLGPQSQGGPERLLSFPLEGYTLALDFPRSDKSLALMDRLDQITLKYHGRVYLAKDSRMSQQTFEAMYGEQVDAFRRARRETGASDAFQSMQSGRLGI
ncbi:MAG: FAD-binding oxidoreductase [Alphaproteobacteria bacterium]|nr:FAD-binding oxidoreductase [Alphaproteobacteria bacterium]